LNKSTIAIIRKRHAMTVGERKFVHTVKKLIDLFD
jgi:hypothetical protein